jgi:hypothetical protein
MYHSLFSDTRNWEPHAKDEYAVVFIKCYDIMIENYNPTQVAYPFLDVRCKVSWKVLCGGRVCPFGGDLSGWYQGLTRSILKFNIGDFQ